MLLVMVSSGMYLTMSVNQGHGLVLTVSTFESFHVPLVGEEVILHAPIAGSRDQDWTALNAKERYLKGLDGFKLLSNKNLSSFIYLCLNLCRA